MKKTKEYYKLLLSMQDNTDSFFDFEPIGLNLSKSEWKILELLCIADLQGEKIISTQIAKKMGITRSAVSQIVDKLESANYVQRVSVPDNKKSVYIEASPLIKRFYAEQTEEVCNRLQQVIDVMGEDEAAEFFRLSDRFIKILKKLKQTMSTTSRIENESLEK